MSEQLERMTLESANSHKTIKVMNVQIQELNIKVEELNRTIVDITSSKQRLSVVRGDDGVDMSPRGVEGDDSGGGNDSEDLAGFVEGKDVVALVMVVVMVRFQQGF